MKRWLMILFVASIGCGRDKSNESAPASSGPPPSASTSAKSEASTQPTAASESKSATAEVTGAYDAKQGEVRMPSDAPPFIHPEGNVGVGAGQLVLALPAGDGEVRGTASGALGEQTFTGWVEAGRLTGNLLPVAGGTPSMTGIVLAAVEGAGDARVVKGDLRASSADGKLVRTATFTLKKK